MNLILLQPEELARATQTQPSDGTLRVVIPGRRAKHVRTIHRAEPGRLLRVGVRGGLVGRATVVEVAHGQVTLDVTLEQKPPSRLPLTVVLAMPRPIVLRRTLAALAAFGVDRIVLLGTAHVEKSYWQSPQTAQDAIDEALDLGLEQGCDTIRPALDIRKYFRPFAEDELPALAAAAATGRALVAHPGADHPCPGAADTPALIAVGPERGFNEFEVETIERAGLERVSLGNRPLRVETALAALVGRLF